jgi:hypothetical protein
MDYNKNKPQAHYTQYGPYSGSSVQSDMMSANGAIDHNQFEVLSA